MGATGLDLLQRLFAPTQFFDNGIYGRCPHERSGIVVPSGEKLLNGFLKILDADEGAPSDAFAGQLPEPPFHQV